MGDDVIAEIKQRLDIESVVGESVRLSRAGRNLKGLCPFHSEKTPSFVVYPKDGSYHCFGCGANGDIFNFLMKTEGLDFRGALEKLAAKAGVEIKPRDEQAAAEDRARERLKEACAAAASFYQNLLLNHPAAGPARAYAEKRGLTQSTIETFQVGFAPDSFDALGNYLLGRGYSAAELVEAGLVAERESGGHYDRFRNRLVFPIRDAKGAVVGFGGRALGDNTPKYLNSPQSSIFDKSSILYGFDLARPHIQRSGQVVIVEGYMDVVIAHQAGQNNVVGTIGTALTDHHAELLKRIAKRVILSLDPDTAGDLAALKGSEVLQEHADKIVVPIRGERGMLGVERRSQVEIRIMQLPRGTDPDELLLSDGGPAKWDALREEALPLVDHVINVVAAKYDLSSARGKSDAVGELALFVREIGEPVQRAHYVQRVAAAIRVPEDAVQEAVGRARPQQRRPERRTPAPQPGPAGGPAPGEAPKPQPDPVTPEEHLLSLVLSYPQTTWMAGAPESEDFTRLENRLIYEALAHAASETTDRTTPNADEIRQAALDSLDDALRPHFTRIASRHEPDLFRFALPYELENRLKRLRQHNDRMWLQQCQLMMQEAQESGDNDTINKLMPLLARSLARFRHYNPKPSTVFRDSRD
ncbi:MAG TPA: DNA primase [Chloroflexia bacterium]|nr:DNA primase [Chloroflexia bacterium]